MPYVNVFPLIPRYSTGDLVTCYVSTLLFLGSGVPLRLTSLQRQHSILCYIGLFTELGTSCEWLLTESHTQKQLVLIDIFIMYSIYVIKVLQCTCIYNTIKDSINELLNQIF